jgi:putative CRISPR-associated protein (TIGR02619 family)
MKNRLFICSVGTSILEQNKVSYRWPSPSSIPNEKDKFLEHYSHQQSQYNYIQCNDISNQTSAEIKSLELYPINNSDKLVLLSTMTHECYFCAKKIEDYFQGNDIDISIEVVEGLRDAGDKNFEQKGLPAFLNAVTSYVEGGKNEYKVVLNPTGGYKSLFPLMTIVGILYGIEVIYVYQDSDNLVKIPSLPLGVDIYEWNRNKIRVDTILDRQLNEVDEIYQKIPPNIISLIKEENGELKSTPIYQFLKNKVSSLDRRFNSLYVKTKYLSLGDRFINRKDLLEKFQKLTEIGHLLWQGDRVPEMVDHALRHHTNLFEIAEKILLPILDNNSKYLSEEELFILLCVIYLHDCGHVIGRVKRGDGDIVQLLPNEIREFHHILGYERLKNYNEDIYQSQILYDKLQWGNNHNEVWDKYLNIIATIGLYHRKRMPLTNGDGKYEDCTFFEDKYEALENKRLKFEGNDIDSYRVLLLASLFRIIDSLDNQVKRTGDMTEIEFHLAQIENEAKEEDARIDSYRNIISQSINKGMLKKLDDLVGKAINYYRESESKSGDSGVSKKLSSKALRNELEKIESNGIENWQYSIIWEYIYSSLKKDFKLYQKEHYEEHAVVDEISISFSEDNGKYTFEIDCKINEKVEKKEAEEKKKKFLQAIKKEYCDEVKDRCSVKQIFNNNCIYIEYKDV